MSDHAQEVMHSLVAVLLSRNIRAQQVAAAAIADICTAAPRMEDAFLAVRPLPLQPTSLPDLPGKQAMSVGRHTLVEYQHSLACPHS